MIIGLVACCKKKMNWAVPAGMMYRSPLFHFRSAFVEKTCDDWYILSAKYGLVHHNTVIEPYNISLHEMNVMERIEWAKMTGEQIKTLNATRLIVFARGVYLLALDKIEYESPLKGINPIGKQIVWLKKETNRTFW